MSETTFARPAPGPMGLVVLLRLFAVPLLGFFCFGLGIGLGVPSDRIALLGVTVATGTLILTVVAVDRTRPRERRNLLLSIFSFSYFAFFIVPVLVYYLGDAGYTSDASPNQVAFTPPDVTRGMLAAFAGYVMLLAGYALPLGRVAANAVPRMRREWSAEAALGVALVIIPLGWAVTLGSQLGLIPARAGSGVLGAIAAGTGFGIGLIALVYQRYRSRAALVLLGVVIPPSMMFNFFTGSKIQFLMPLVMIVMSHIIVTRRLRAWWIVGFLAVMSLFYPVAQVYRLYIAHNNLNAVQVIASPHNIVGLLASFATSFELSEYLETGINATARRLDGLGILCVIMRDAGTRVPFQGGWSIAYIPLAYIPRLLWAGKPSLGIGQWVTDNFGSGPDIISSTGATWMGEFYFNFGWTGLLIGMVVMGAWLRFLQESFLGMDATIPAMLAGIIAILTLAAGVGGDLLAAFNTVIFRVAPIMLIHLAVRTVTPPPARPPPPL